MLTVTSFQGHASHDSIEDSETDNMATIILHKALELLDPLLDAGPVVAVSPGLHVDAHTAGVIPSTGGYCKHTKE